MPGSQKIHRIFIKSFFQARLKSIKCFFSNEVGVKKKITRHGLVTQILSDMHDGNDAIHELGKFVLCKTKIIFRIAWHF